MDVDINDILELRALHYKWTKIATILGLSRTTLYRRLEEAGVSLDDYTQVSDEQLDEVICSIKQDHPNDGEVLLQGHLLRQGIRVRRYALRNAIHRVDHSNTVTRKHSLVRRIYSVSHPNYIWHVDGHRKLIRWRFVIHGAVDGFSCTITYLKCADNNQGTTVLDLFCKAVSRFSLPNYVRSDHGGENVGIWKCMILSHSNNYSRVLTRSSVHNERIERMWCDVHQRIASTYADTFRNLESEDLDPLNEVDLYCLHYVFLPHINKSISEFQESWNHHALSSEGSMSPYQLFFEGVNHWVRYYGYNVPSLDGDIDLSELTGEHANVP